MVNPAAHYACVPSHVSRYVNSLAFEPAFDLRSRSQGQAAATKLWVGEDLLGSVQQSDAEGGVPNVDEPPVYPSLNPPDPRAAAGGAFQAPGAFSTPPVGSAGPH